jgi:hypothetical protein
VGTKSKADAASLPAGSNAKALPSKDTIVVVKSEEDPRKSSHHATGSTYKPAMMISDSDSDSTGDSDSDGSSSGSDSQSCTDPKHSLSVPAVIFL